MSPEATARTRRRAWVVRAPGDRARIAVAFVGFVLIGVLSGGSGVLLSTQIEHYGVDKALWGVTFGTFSIGYVSGAMANGPLIHRLGLRSVLLIGSGTLLASALAIGARPAFGVFVFLPMGLGLGAGAFEGGLNVYLTGLPGSTSLLNTLHAFFGVGAMVGPVLAGRLLASGLPWNAFHLLYAGAVALLVVAVLRLYPRAGPHPPGARRPRLSTALRRPAVWLGGVFLALYVGIEVSVGQWGFSFLAEERGLTLLAASSVVSGYWTGLTAGRFLLARVARRFGVGEVGLLTGCLVGIAAASLVVWLVPAPAVAAVGLFLFGFGLGPVYPTTIAVVPRLVPAGLVATAVGLFVGFSDGGAALMPWLAGVTAQRVGTWSLFPFVLAATLPLMLVWWLMARRLAPEPAPVNAEAAGAAEREAEA
jgi:fucose permease